MKKLTKDGPACVRLFIIPGCRRPAGIVRRKHNYRAENVNIIRWVSYKQTLPAALLHALYYDGCKADSFGPAAQRKGASPTAPVAALFGGAGIVLPIFIPVNMVLI